MVVQRTKGLATASARVRSPVATPHGTAGRAITGFQFKQIAVRFCPSPRRGWRILNLTGFSVSSLGSGLNGGAARNRLGYPEFLKN